MAYAMTIFEESSREFLLNNPESFFLNYLWAGFTFYIFYIYFSVKFFEKRRLIVYSTISILHSLVVTTLHTLLYFYIYPDFRELDISFFVSGCFGTIIISQCGTLLRGFNSWFDSIQQRAEMKQQLLHYELSILRSQLNPHFLFNTLNNIDSLLYKSPTDASDVLLRLSDVLRYMVYESNREMVVLRGEIDCVKKIVELQKIRFNHRDYIELNIPAEVIEKQIAPLMFLPFIENAFKHAVSYDIYPVIKIDISLEESDLIFKCSNYFSNQVERETSSDGGVGLKNVKRRLALIYDGQYDLSIESVDNIFNVYLKINLTP